MGKNKAVKAPKQVSDSGLLERLTSLVFVLFLCTLLLNYLTHP